jgi:hypothetical protein
MFGDNQAVVSNSTIPHSSLSKRHNALAYHRVREMISAKILGYYWIDGKRNPTDILSKHWSYPQVWHLLKPLLFYSGEKFDLLEEENNVTKYHILITSQELSYLSQYISKHVDSNIITCYTLRATI